MLNKYLLSVCFLLLIMSACRKDERILKGPGTMGFSTDTVYFDTVFTKLPGSPYPRSINKQFMVRNPYNETVKMNVRLGGGSNSVYRINVDGRSGTIIQDIEILPKDSTWVFVEATLEANNATNPILVRDSIEFETNGNLQYVQLAAYGWDAYYFKDTVFEVNTSWILNDKPYVIVNTSFIDVGVTLTIGPGIHVYSTTNSVLVDTNNVKYYYHALNVLGTLKVNGTQSNPVIFEGDRLDNSFADKPGQWQGIGFYRTSVDNVIHHAIIKNATYGVRVDSLSNNANPKLTITNSIIKNMSGLGIWGRTGSIFCQNTVVSNCAIALFYAQLGGQYEFYHCTMNNVSAGSKDPHFIISNQERNDNKVVVKTYPIGFTIVNNIINGPNETEFFFDLHASQNLPNPSIIQKNLLRYKGKIGVSNYYITNKTTGGGVNNDPKFEEPSKSLLKIKSDSPARDSALLIGVTIDLEDKSRDSKPDLGAYEYQ